MEKRTFAIRCFKPELTEVIISMIAYICKVGVSKAKYEEWLTSKYKIKPTYEGKIFSIESFIQDLFCDTYGIDKRHIETYINEENKFIYSFHNHSIFKTAERNLHTCPMSTVDTIIKEFSTLFKSTLNVYIASLYKAFKYKLLELIDKKHIVGVVTRNAIASAGDILYSFITFDDKSYISFIMKYTQVHTINVSSEIDDMFNTNIVVNSDIKNLKIFYNLLYMIQNN